jgi:hypothetical protein
MTSTLRCQQCEGVIGRYEPMIELTAGQVRKTSIAAARDTDGPVGECYHDECFTQVARSRGWPAADRALWAGQLSPKARES